MNTHKHTPAPWQVDYSGNCHIGITDKNERTIAFCNLQSEDGDEDELNARLIAAAPDLLDALQTLLKISEKELNQSATHDGLKNCEALAKARQAIKEATH